MISEFKLSNALKYAKSILAKRIKLPLIGELFINL
jgi:hypothetical protein